MPEEYWSIQANFTPDLKAAPKLAADWAKTIAHRDEKNQPPTLRVLNAWLAEHGGFKGELVEINGEKFDLTSSGTPGMSKPSGASESPDRKANAPRLFYSLFLPRPHAAHRRDRHGRRSLNPGRIQIREDDKAKGPAKFLRTVTGDIDPSTPYTITAIETKPHHLAPRAPFITSTLQQAASSRSGRAQRTMRAAQQLYEGIDIPGEGPVGLITYMRTDSTHLSREALDDGPRYIDTQLRRPSTSPRSPTSSPPPTRPPRKPTRPSARPRSTTRPTASRTRSPATSSSLYQLI